MNQRILIALVVMTACGQSRAEKCAAIRDRMLEENTKLFAAAFAGGQPTDDTQKARDAQVLKLKTRFVEACMAEDKLDLDCFEPGETAKHRSPECKQPLETLWKAVYGAN